MLMVMWLAFSKTGIAGGGVLNSAVGMVHQSGSRGSALQGHPERGNGEIVFQRAIQRPADHTAGEGVQYDRQVNELHFQSDVSDVRHPELIQAGEFHIACQIRIHGTAVIGIRRCHHELPPAQTEQIVFAHDPVDPVMSHCPASPVQFGRDARAPIAGEFQRDPLDRVPQIDVGISGGRRGAEPIESGPAHLPEQAHLPDAHDCFLLDLVSDFFADCGFPVTACRIRRSSMRRKQFFKKSISSVCWPIFRSSCAFSFSSHRRLPAPGNEFPGASRNSCRQRCNKLGFTSNARATSATEEPDSSRCTAASFISRVNFLRDNPMSQNLHSMIFDS
jgi:hypothetical protein